MMTARESHRPPLSAALFPVLAGVVLALPLPPGPTAAAEVQPNALRFGSVRVCATVEGSIRIFRKGDDASGLAIKVEPPAFLRVEDVRVGSQQLGNGNRGYCDIWVSVRHPAPGSIPASCALSSAASRSPSRWARRCGPRCPA